jgi:hypothetical protein
LARANTSNANSVPSRDIRSAKFIRDVYLDFIDEVLDIQDLKVVKVKDFEEDVERAAEIQDTVIIAALAEGELFVLDFPNVPFATQSFVHALMYKVLREHVAFQSCLSIAGCSASTREAVRAVAAPVPGRA